MKLRKKIRVFLLGICLFTLMSINVYASETSKEATIVFTHDLHSHLDSFYSDIDGNRQEVGGFARIKTYIDEVKEENPDALVLDGGDFSMGTLYQTVYETQASELRMLGALGIDVTTMGNHEFDYRTSGLNNMLQSAMGSGDVLPEFVLCNVDWEATLAQGIGEVEDLKATMDRYEIKPYVMVEKGDLSVAVVGVFGKDALECSPTCELIFEDPIKAVKETVAEIQAQEKADLIVCVSHGGTWENEEDSEDEQLAKEVPELDLIISGHTHSLLEEPIIHENTVIVSTGEYGIRVGTVKLAQNEDGRWSVSDYDVTPMTTDIEEDESITEKIQQIGSTIDSEYLEQFGYTKEQVLAHNPWENPALPEISEYLQENAYTNLLADAYLDTLNQLPELQEDPIDVAIVPAGVIRDVFYEDTDVTVSDVFNVLSLGIGPDKVAGYPLISIYLTGEELQTAAEVDASISPMMPTAQLFMSGLNYTFNPNRLILNKITKASLADVDGNETELVDDKLYRVVADLYSGQMLGAVSEQSFGILSIVPKDAQGNPIDNLEDYIVYDGNQEMKAWVAVARYVEKMGNEAGEISEYYSTTHNRKVVDDDNSLGAKLENPNKIAIVLLCIILVVLIVLTTIIVLIIRRIKKNKRKKLEQQNR